MSSKNPFRGKSPFGESVNRFKQSPMGSQKHNDLESQLASGDDKTSTRALMHKKLYLMKLMLKNEKKANQIISEQINTLTGN